MGEDCSTCTCRTAERQAVAGRLVLATVVDHTATALRSAALSAGRRLEVLAPGLLELVGDAPEEVLLAARDALSSVEAQEVRCLLASPDLEGTALLAQALRAPSLAAAGARVDSAALLALLDDELAAFSSVYQPIVELAGGRTVGHEALLRATDAAGGEVLPDVLFPAASAAGWLNVLDRIGRTTALRHAGPWLGDDLLFINFVPTSIYRPEICLRTTEQAAADAGLDLRQLVFEVTEGERVTDVDHLAEVFSYYRSRGCRVALDDLGAGYSSLNLLVRLQPDVVKLDKEIVQALPDPVSSAVVEAIVSITHAYGGTVLAECLETQEQADAARALGVDLGQGWLFGRPVRPSGAASGRSGPSRVTRRASPERVAAPPAAAPPVSSDSLDALLARAVASSENGVVVVDAREPDMPLVHVNRAFERMSGYSAAELLGHNCRVLQAPETDRATVRRLGEAIRAGVPHSCVLRNVRKDGSLWWNELHLSPVRDGDGTLTHYLGFQYDVSARRSAEDRLRYLSDHDGLTGLLNRLSLVRELDAAVARSATEGRRTAVLFLDLDGFKAVNDSAGHLVGDRVLAEVAVRLTAALRSGDVLARHGGDEFVAVLSGLDPFDADRIASRVAGDLLAALHRPVPVGDGVARLGASIGIAVDLDGSSTANGLLRAADAAMYAAKRRGPGGVARAAEEGGSAGQE